MLNREEKDWKSEELVIWEISEISSRNIEKHKEKWIRAHIKPEKAHTRKGKVQHIDRILNFLNWVQNEHEFIQTVSKSENCIIMKNGRLLRYCNHIKSCIMKNLKKNLR